MIPPPGCNFALYDLYASTDPNFQPSPSNRIAFQILVNKFAHKGLQPSTTYYYIVRAVTPLANRVIPTKPAPLPSRDRPAVATSPTPIRMIGAPASPLPSPSRTPATRRSTAGISPGPGQATSKSTSRGIPITTSKAKSFADQRRLERDHQSRAGADGHRLQRYLQRAEQQPGYFLSQRIALPVRR